ncbi:MAG: hypothetical protein ACLFNK_05525, partial [Candidatus Woesearchaeota archaeon]
EFMFWGAISNASIDEEKSRITNIESDVMACEMFFAELFPECGEDFSQDMLNMCEADSTLNRACEFTSPSTGQTATISISGDIEPCFRYEASEGGSIGCYNLTDDENEKIAEILLDYSQGNLKTLGLFEISEEKLLEKLSIEGKCNMTE